MILSAGSPSPPPQAAPAGDDTGGEELNAAFVASLV
jgi:hypothetical protein